jgi:hypothetical protein
MKHIWGLLGAVVLLTCFLALPSCNKEDDFVADFKYEYFPTDSGRYVIYDVDSIIFNSFFVPPLKDTINFQVREVYQETFTDGAGNRLRRIERFRRNDTIGNWVLTDVWYAGIVNNQAIWVEENLRLLKLVFPPKADSQWNGNQYIQITEGIEFMEGWEYNITALDVPNTINGLSFDSTLTVVLADDTASLIERITATETYAKGVGLIYKDWQWLKKQNVVAQFPQGTEDGFIVRMRVREYGNL